MDEVDFTILAATSVLGDLVEKCPPAEACRDAFDRMSKATVAMCMSTTGFSSNAPGGVPGGGGLNSHRRPLPQQHQMVQKSEQDPNYFQHLELQQMRNGGVFATSNARGQPQQQQQQRRQQSVQSQQIKPRPQFDMGLNDLYAPSPVLANRSVLSHKRNSIGGQIKSEDSPAAFAIPRSEDPTPTPAQQQSRTQSHYGLSPPTTNFNSGPPSTGGGEQIDPNLMPQRQRQQQQGQQMPYMTSPTNLTPTNLNTMNYMPAQSYNNAIPNQNMEVDFSNLPEFSNLDFLNDPNINYNGMSGNSGDVNMDGTNGMGAMQGNGVNLGFGWGAEGDGHDFSEGGNQLDFFDGFYFGTGV